MTAGAYRITDEDDYITFAECYKHAYGASIVSIDFLRNCEEVYLFRDEGGRPFAGYSINTKQDYRTLSYIPIELAIHFRERSQGRDSYELGTVWIDATRRSFRERMELWAHIFGNMLSRAGSVMVGNTVSEELYRAYADRGVQLAYFGPMDDGDGGYIDGWIFYLEDVASSKVPEAYEQLKQRLG
jgi:hypothetical protein